MTLEITDRVACRFIAQFFGKKPRPRRRTATLSERLTPCLFCEYPISQRHHLYDVSKYGEGDDDSSVIQLCANCHELYHICKTFVETRNPKCATYIEAFRTKFGDKDTRLLVALELAEMVYLSEQKMQKPEVETSPEFKNEQLQIF